MQAAYLWASILTAVVIQASYSSAKAYEHPAQVAILSLLLATLTFHSVLRLRPQFFDDIPNEGAQHEAIGQGTRLDVTANKTADVFESHLFGLRKQTSIQVFAAIALALRIEIFRRITYSEECVGESLISFLPLILSIYDLRAQSAIEVNDDRPMDSSIYDELRSNLWRLVVRSRWRYIPSAFVTGIGCYALTSIQQGRTSTIICPITSGHAAWIPRLQALSVSLDVVLAILAELLAFNRNLASAASVTGHPYMAVMTGAVVMWTAVAVGILAVNMEKNSWITAFDFARHTSVFVSILWQAVLVTCFVFSTTKLMIFHGIFAVSLLLTLVTRISTSIYFVWSNRQPYPVISAWISTLGFIMSFVGVWSYTRIYHLVSPGKHTYFGVNIAISSLAISLVLWLVLTKTSRIYFHPIDLLMYDARHQHDNYLRFANHSGDLEAAVTLYQNRYQSNPPPGFDIWWDFAQLRNSTITDDFDQIYVDLLPFRTVVPYELRLQTHEIISNPWNDIEGVRIRQGSAYPLGNVHGTHAMMLEGIVSMINKFAEHLPDMDLAFNLNDLPRVVVPRREFYDTKHDARQIKFHGHMKWLQNRDADWSQEDLASSVVTVFEEQSMQSIFDNFGTINCPINSAVWRSNVNRFAPYMCTSCAFPHSIGQFVSNWSLAADPCHQPDLAQLYGGYLSPATFKPTRKLRPVFSQSKMHGFNDILYPSIRNYMDMVSYSPTNTSNDSFRGVSKEVYPDLPFSNKVNALYWRGGTMEGLSYGHREWRGMARQRFVHMANNLTNSFHDHMTLLLPDPDQEDQYSYQVLSAAEFLSLGIQTDVHFDHHITNCEGSDCRDQEAEMGIVSPSDFQQHWKHRFLIDLDGPGSTGHFLPFLKSHSVPFKAGMLREWYDSRLTPWRHFVPQDLRFHGLWSTLAYFAGIDGSLGPQGRQVKWEPHLREAELIAEEGRKWANKVLRKEDMEIYMFRLLLEWARLTDDKRDELGFVL